MNFVFRRFSFAVLSRTTRPRVPFLDFVPKVTSVKAGLHTSRATLADATGKMPTRDSVDPDDPEEDHRIFEEIIQGYREGKDLREIQQSMGLNDKYVRSLAEMLLGLRDRLLLENCLSCDDNVLLHPAPVDEETSFYKRNGAYSMEQQLEVLTDALKRHMRGDFEELILSGWDQKDIDAILRKVQSGMDKVRRQTGRANLIAYLHACIVYVSKDGCFEFDRNKKPADETEKRVNSDNNVERKETHQANGTTASGIPKRDLLSSENFAEDRRIWKNIFQMCKEGRTRQDIQDSLGLSDKYLKSFLELLKTAKDDDEVKKNMLIGKCKTCNNVLLNPLPPRRLRTYDQNQAKSMQHQLELLVDAAIGERSRWDPTDVTEVVTRASLDLDMDCGLKSRLQSRTHLIVYLHACLVYVSLDYQEDYT